MKKDIFDLLSEVEAFKTEDNCNNSPASLKADILHSDCSAKDHQTMNFPGQSCSHEQGISCHVVESSQVPLSSNSRCNQDTNDDHNIEFKECTGNVRYEPTVPWHFVLSEFHYFTPINVTACLYHSRSLAKLSLICIECIVEISDSKIRYNPTVHNLCKFAKNHFKAHYFVTCKWASFFSQA